MHGSATPFTVTSVTGTGVTFPGASVASPGTSVTEGVGAPTLGG